MVSRVLMRKLRRDLWHRKGALLALLAIVVVGVGVYVGMASVYRDLDGARERYYRDYRLADFTVDLKRAPLWAADAVAELPNVRAVRPRVSLAVRIELPGREEPLPGTAISMPDRPVPVLNDILLRSGTWFTDREAKEAILNEAFARANGLGPGNRVRVLLLDQQHDLLVVGTAMSPEFVYLIPPGAGLAPDPARFGVLYLPEAFLRETCNLEGAFNQLVGLAHDPSRAALDRTLRLIEERLDPYGVTLSTPVGEQTSTRFLADELTGLRVSVIVIPLIFLGVAALVLNVLIGRLVAQQRTAIGTLRALGYSRGAITRHYLGYGVAIGVLGGLGGVPFGGWLQGAMCAIYRQFFALPAIVRRTYPDVFLAGMAISLAFAVLGTLRGVRRAARLAPAEAMRPPPPETGGKVLPERLPALWRPLPFGWKMVLRAVFRNPFRSTVTVLGSAVGTSLIVATLCLVSALGVLIDHEFTRVSHEDVRVSLRDPRGVEAVAEFEALPDVSYGEGELGVVCDLTRGPRRRRVAVTGLPRRHRLCTPLDAAGRRIEPPDEGLLLSRKLAELLGVRPGDALRLRPLIGERREVPAVVVGTAETYLGLSAYADRRYLSRLIGESDVANVLLGAAFGDPRRSAFLAALKERPSVLGLAERVRSLSQIHDTFEKHLNVNILVMVFFAGLIAFGSVLNAALVSLSERQREVGTLRVLGYTPGQIARIFSGESGLLNGLGVLLGLGGGIGLAYLLARAYDTELYRFPVAIDPSQLVLGAALMAAFIGAAQLIIYRLIHRLPWLDVMKVKE